MQLVHSLKVQVEVVTMLGCQRLLMLTGCRLVDFDGLQQTKKQLSGLSAHKEGDEFVDRLFLIFFNKALKSFLVK